MLAQFIEIHDIENWFYKKNFQIFSNLFSIFFSFCNILHIQKDFFCTFGLKITYFYILGGQHVHLIFRGLFYYSYLLLSLLYHPPNPP